MFVKASGGGDPIGTGGGPQYVVQIGLSSIKVGFSPINRVLGFADGAEGRPPQNPPLDIQICKLNE